MSRPEAAGGIARRTPRSVPARRPDLRRDDGASAVDLRRPGHLAGRGRRAADRRSECGTRRPHQGSAASGTDRSDTGRTTRRQRTDTRQGAPGGGVSRGLRSPTSTRGSISSDRRLPTVRPRPPPIAGQRTTLDRARERFNAAERQLTLIAVEAEQLSARISGMQRDRFVQQIFEVEPVDPQSGAVVGRRSFAGRSGRPAGDIADRLACRSHDTNVSRVARSGFCRHRRPAVAHSLPSTGHLPVAMNRC